MPASVRNLFIPLCIAALCVVACLPDGRGGGRGDDDDDAGADCFTDIDCSEGEEYCKAADPSASPEGQCTSLESAGDSCLLGSHCVAGLFCLVGDTSGDGTCRAAPSSCNDGPSCSCDPMLEMCAVGGLSCDGSGDSVTLRCYNGVNESVGDDDDDDTSVGDDDTSTVDDDDDTSVPLDLPTCSGPSVSFTETEPNNGPEAPDLNVIVASDGDLVISGSMSVCSNDGKTWTGDTDVFSVDYGCMGDATFTLTWTGTDVDMDYNVAALAWSDAEYAAIGYEFSTDPIEQMSNTGIGGPMLIQVLCWEGSGSPEWTFTIDWDSAPNN